MRIKTFPVPFAEIVKDAPELEFGPEDFVVVRPLFSQPTKTIRDFWSRLTKAEPEVPDGTPEAKAEKLRAEADAAADALILETLDRTIVEWHLAGDDGPIQQPHTADELNALPGPVKGSLFAFLTSYRGKGPDPTPAD